MQDPGRDAVDDLVLLADVTVVVEGAARLALRRAAAFDEHEAAWRGRCELAAEGAHLVRPARPARVVGVVYDEGRNAQGLDFLRGDGAIDLVGDDRGREHQSGDQRLAVGERGGGG